PGNVLDIEAGNGSDTGLDVNGYLSSVARFGNSQNNGMFLQMLDDAGAVTHMFRTYGDSYINNGNVGIGTTSPEGVLHISKYSDPYLMVENSGDTSIPRIATIEFKHSNGTGARIRGIRESGNSTGMGLIFQTQPIVGGDVIEAMRIDTSGNVGIGTVVPGSRLAISGGATVGSAYDGVALSDGDMAISGNIGIGMASPIANLHIGGSYCSFQMGSDSTEANNFHWVNEYNWNGDGIRALRLYNGDKGSGTSLMTVINSGNVGIGTTSPEAKLDVAGNIRSSTLTVSESDHGSIAIKGDSTINSALLNFFDNGSGNYWHLAMRGTDHGSESEDFLLSYNDGSWHEVLRVDSITRNIGIGTTSPIFALDVKPATSNTILRAGFNAVMETLSTDNQVIFGRNVQFSSSAPGWTYINDGCASAVRMYAEGSIGFLSAGSGTTGASLTTWDTSDIKMYLRNDGNLGIGTTSPGSQLSVAKGIEINRNNNANIADTGNHDASVQDYSIQFGAGSGEYIFSNRVDNSSNRYGLSFGTAWVTRMAITNQGNVGIGTTSPGRMFTVNQGSGDWASFQYSGTETFSIQDNTATINFSTNDIVNDRGFSFTTYSGEKVRITKDGNIGIGTTSPSYKLDVNGQIRCTSLIQTSDIRLKEDITPIDNALEKVTALRGVGFKWRVEEYPEKDLTDGRKIGLIAQEVEEVLPEVVSTDDEGYKAVEYGNLVGVLVEAVKELQAQNKALEAENELIRRELESENESLRQEIEQIKEAIEL
ncbi:MAG: tail fiber domain-containing protein, partial [bacterium]